MDRHIISRALAIYNPEGVAGRHTLVVEHSGICPICKREIIKTNRYTLFDEELSKGEKGVTGFCSRITQRPMCTYGWFNIVHLSSEPENENSSEGQITWVMV